MRALALCVAGVLATAGCSTCGFNCDDSCNCGRCSTKPGCSSEDKCMKNCNHGGNAKWCGGSGPSPTPPSPTPPSPAPPSPHGSCQACGYNCDHNCNCKRCNTKPFCGSSDTCMGPCNSGKNAKWCGVDKPPTPPIPTPPPPPPSTWSTASNKLQRNGQDVLVHGIGTTCTEYLARGIGMKCFVHYDFADPSNILQPDNDYLNPLIQTLMAVASEGIVPAVRIPMAASSWLGVETKASSANRKKYPELDKQYQGFIAALVEKYTSYGIAVILDLHWTDDDTNNAPMAGKNTVDFWDSVAAKFGANTLVFYELYNEPHIRDPTTAAYMHGDSTHAGMLELLAAVRKHTEGPVIIAGARGFAFDADSLVELDVELLKQGAKNVIWNFHPYMGPHQAGANNKCPAGVEGMVQTVLTKTARPVIFTEFGQSCCKTGGACESCPGNFGGKSMGYAEAVLTIAQKHGVSWLPWAWRPMAVGPNEKTCEDVNGGSNGTAIGHCPDGNGADFLALWQQFSGATPGPSPAPGPAPSSGCPGGSLSACVGLCPTSPEAYKACAQTCQHKCQETLVI